MGKLPGRMAEVLERLLMAAAIALSMLGDRDSITWLMTMLVSEAPPRRAEGAAATSPAQARRQSTYMGGCEAYTKPVHHMLSYGISNSFQPYFGPPLTCQPNLPFNGYN